MISGPSALFLPLVLTVAASAPLAAQSCVWKVSSPEHTIYVGGTFHLLRPQDFPLPAEFDTAFRAAQSVFFETDIARMLQPETAMLLFRAGTYEGTTTLESTLTPEAWKAVRDYCAGAGINPSDINRLKPGAFIIMVSGLELPKIGISEMGVDVHYFRAAETAGKTVGGLETLDEHLRLLVNMGAGHESEFVQASLAEIGEMRAMLERMLVAWRRGDLPTIDKEMLQEMRTGFPAVFADLIVKRNQAWLPQIEAMLTTPAVELVLVGAGHLAGPEGLIAQLEGRGYRAEQVVAEEKPAVPAR